MPGRNYVLSILGLLCLSQCFAQSILSLSSASGASGGPVTLNVSLNTAYPGSSAGLEWSLNAPTPEVASFTTSPGPAAVAAQKSLYCANQTCLLVGLNSNAFSDGVVAVITLTLSPAATGNLVIQLSNPVEALLDGTGGSITSANGIVNVTTIAAPVSIAVAPATASLRGGQSLQLAATVTGGSNSNVTWTLNPTVGTLSNSGLYTAPSIISSAQTVIVTATSAADTTKSASATITLVPTILVTVIPAQVSLGASQTQQFSASVSNAGNIGVTWSLIPPVGTISNGLYTAPAVITSARTVSVVATSVADPTASGSASVMLIPPVSVSLSPAAVSVGPSQTAQFTATVANTANTAVNWTLAPPLGSIANGLYTAPANISAFQTITVTATSVADPSKSASSLIYLLPGVGVSLSPAAVSLGPTGTQQFSASVTNASNTAVTWSLNPELGSISNGFYTAPFRIPRPQPQTVTVTATSVADPSKSATAVVTLVAPRPHKGRRPPRVPSRP